MKRFGLVAQGEAMVASCTLSLRPPEKQALEAEARHAEKSYQREWAAASLKIAAIHSPHWVARYGLLTARDPDTVHGWLDHYAADRVAHWQVPHGCGRKPAFSPAQPDATTAQTALLQVVRRQPSLFGHAQTRWRLATILASCPWLRLPSVSRLLKRLGITYQRGRDYVHGPAAHYQAKLDLVEQLRLRAYYAPEHYALLYLDEMSFYGQPSLSSAYAAQGEAQPRAERSQRSDTCARVVARLNAITGAVHYRQRSHIDTVTLAGFWADLRQAYPTVATLYVVVDNCLCIFIMFINRRATNAACRFRPNLAIARGSGIVSVGKNPVFFLSECKAMYTSTAIQLIHHRHHLHPHRALRVLLLRR